MKARARPIATLRRPAEAAGGPAAGQAEAVDVVARRAARVIAAGAAAGFVAVVATVAVRNHQAFRNAGLDFASFDQGLWLLSRFREPFLTTLGVNLFGDHTSFILTFLTPLYWLVPSPSALLVLQAVALGLGALPVFLIARDRLGDEWLACGASVAYLLHPAVAWTGLDEFHPDALEVPLLLFAFHAALTARWRRFAVLVAALLLVKEDVALLTFGLGLYVALRHHRRVGLAVSAVSVAWFALTTFVILPAFNSVGTLDSWRVPFGGVRGLAKVTLTRPWDVAALLVGPSQRGYVAAMLVPVALLPVLALPVLLVGTGPLLSNLLSTWPYQRDVQFHYSTLLVPVVLVAAVLGAARLPVARRRAAVVALVAGGVVGSLVWGPAGGNRTEAWAAAPPASAVGPARAAIAMVPGDAAVATMVQFAPHLSHREDLYLFPNPWRSTAYGDERTAGQRLPAADDVDYVLLTDQFVTGYPGAASLVDELRRDDFRAVLAEGGVLLLERVATPS